MLLPDPVGLDCRLMEAACILQVQFVYMTRQRFGSWALSLRLFLAFLRVHKKTVPSLEEAIEARQKKGSP